MRDLERLQDVVEYRISPGQLRLLFIGVLAVACALFAVGVSVGKRLEPLSSSLVVDPLAQLDRVSGREEADEREGSPEERPALTYHDELTARPEEAEARPAPVPVARVAAAASVPPSAPAAPRPARQAPSPLSEGEIPDEPARPEQPNPGESSVFTLQVASFETREEAGDFAGDLRSRGHSVFLVRTSTPERGTWYRVRVGPFHSRREATGYQARFERTERLPTFLVQRRR